MPTDVSRKSERTSTESLGSAITTFEGCYAAFTAVDYTQKGTLGLDKFVGSAYTHTILPLAHGSEAAVDPLALTTVLEEEAHVHDFQVVQTASGRLKVRLGSEEAAAAGAVRRALQAYFRAMGFADVILDIGPQAPRRDRVSGKLRRVVCELERVLH